MERTYTLSELPEIAQQLLTTTASKRFLFYGAMGVGKTTLIKEMIKQLGVSDTISSPTYALVNEYQHDQEVIYHFDFYRLKTIEEAFDIGAEEYFESDNWLFIEWPERIEKIAPEEYIKVNLAKIDPNTRTIKTLLVK